MPRKKAEPEVLQEETVQPEITETEEKAIMEQPTVEPQVEEPATSEPVQPYGEEEPSAAKEESESSEPEKKSFYDLDIRALDQDLSPEQRQEWNTIYASFRSRSVMRGTIIGVDPHSIDGGCFGLFFAVFQSTRRFQMAAFLHSLHRFQAA